MSRRVTANGCLIVFFFFFFSQSPATPYNSVEDFSKQAAQAKKKQQAPTLDAEALNSKLQDLGN